MSDEAMALALLLSTLERIAVAVERIAESLSDPAAEFVRRQGEEG
jgi:hypothetical protein